MPAMTIQRTAVALLLALTFAAAAYAQEYDRASGGVIATTVKTPQSFSGSLDFGLPFLSSQGARRNTRPSFNATNALAAGSRITAK